MPAPASQPRHPHHILLLTLLLTLLLKLTGESCWGAHELPYLPELLGIPDS